MKGGYHLQILDQHVEKLAAALGGVDALEHGGHVAGLDGLEDLEDGLEVGVAGGVVAGVDGALEAAPQGALGIAAPEQLAHPLVELPGVGLARLGQRRVQRRRVKVLRRLGVQRVDVDGPPGVAQRRRRVLLDDRHGGLSSLVVCFLLFRLPVVPTPAVSISDVPRSYIGCRPCFAIVNIA